VRPLEICLISAELAPLAKSGGLGDVCAALARHLHLAGHELRVFLPFHSLIATTDREVVPVDFLRDLASPLAGREYRYSIFTTPLPGSPLWVYLIDCPELYDRPTLYTSARDEDLRFALLQRAAIESCQRMGFGPDIVHAHDWHAALAPLYLRRVFGWDQLFADTRVVLTIHNLAHQGVFPHSTIERIGLGNERHLFPSEDLDEGKVNFLKTGLLHADWLTTVSPTYAEEIQSRELGLGLDGILRERHDRLTGILNGVDYDEWNPSTDPWVPHPYDASDLSGKRRTKQALLRELSLDPDPEPALLGIVSRLVVQKGFDLLFGPLPDLLARSGARLAVLGSGEPRYEGFFSALQDRFPGQVCFYRGFSEQLAHRIEAAADIFLMPSQFEPCGLNQMYSLRYGTVPVVRKTGGLADSVEPYDRATGRGTGFVFEHFTPDGFRWALEEALSLYRDAEAWRGLVTNGMARDFSWDRQIGRYVDLYRALLPSAG
jgi:starch synthase